MTFQKKGHFNLLYSILENHSAIGILIVSELSAIYDALRDGAINVRILAL